MMQVRLKIGDTGPDFMLDDREIEFYLSENNNEVIRAALAAVTSILGKLVEDVNFTLGPYREDNSNRVNFFTALKTQLESQISNTNSPLMRTPTTSPIFGYDLMSSNPIKYGGRRFPFDESFN